MNDVFMQQYIDNLNNTPTEKLSGLAPLQVHELIYNPLGENSYIKLNLDLNDDILNQIPFFKIVESLLKIIDRDGFIKLTPLGALPKKVVVELYDFKFIAEEIIESGLYKLHHEDNSITIMTARIVCQASNLVKKSNGKLLLTKNGQNSLKPDNRAALFKNIFLIFTEKYNWGYNDGYPDEPIGQFGYLFSIYLLKKYGEEERTTRFYADKYLQVFERMLTVFNESYKTPENQFSKCYSLRSFSRFTEWFGFTNIKANKSFDIDDMISKTALLDAVFIID